MLGVEAVRCLQGFSVVHHKTDRVPRLIHKAKTGGLGVTEMGSGCAGKLRGGGHVAGLQGLRQGEARLWDAAGHTRPSDGVTYDISQSAPEGCVYYISALGVVESFSTHRGLDINRSQGVYGRYPLDCFSFLCSLG